MRWPDPKRNPEEVGVGRVLALTPKQAELARVRAGRWTAGEYMAALRRRWLEYAQHLAPGAVVWYSVALPRTKGQEWDGDSWALGEPVEAGSVLVCSCSLEVAARGECHRVAAAGALHDAGWGVILDGDAWPRAEQAELGL
ncbi:MAG: hypothetical protein ABII82_02180 [Verrucomicrobiota bacterium]